MRFLTFLFSAFFLFSQSSVALAEDFDIPQKIYETVQTPLTTASTEVSKSQALADFGKKELERKKQSLNTLVPQYNKLGQDRDAKKERIATLEKDIAKYPTTTKGKQITAAQVAYAQAEVEGMKMVNQYGFITSSSSDTQKLIDEEYLNQKLWNDNAIKVGTAEGAAAQTKEVLAVSSLGISLSPYLGELYDGTSLLLNKDPITGEILTPFTKILTVAGLASGVGSGVLARKAGKEAIVEIATKTGLSEDEVWTIAGEVAKGYTLESLSDLKTLWKSISFENIKKQVLEKAEILKASKIPKIVIPKLKSIEIVHITERHAFGSTPTASKFLEKSDIEGLIKTGYASSSKRSVKTISKNPITNIEFNSIKIEVDFGKTIGVSSKKDASLLRIIVDLDGNVVSAYPLDKFSITQ